MTFIEMMALTTAFAVFQAAPIGVTGGPEPDTEVVADALIEPEPVTADSEPPGSGEGAVAEDDAPEPESENVIPEFVVETPEQAVETAAEVFDYIESISTLRGRFIQIGPYDAVAEGAFFLRRPGRIRFEYDPPNPNLIVADGSWVIVRDRDLETTDRLPIGATPLKFLLRRSVDRDDLEILQVDRTPGVIAITIGARDEETQGVLTMVFAEPTLELRQWTITDPQGLVTTVALTDLVKGERLDPRLFVVRDQTRFTRNR